ncbi:hypothetical protein MC885_016833 [Smutsia gigantea]|nr:hypothetical protein MC885_016833 [Smutsia gigantea]
MCWQELQAIRLKLWATEQAQGRAGAEGGTRAKAALTRQRLSPKTGRNSGPDWAFPVGGPFPLRLGGCRPLQGTRAESGLDMLPLTQGTHILSAGCFCPGNPMEKVEADHRSIYVGSGEASAGATGPCLCRVDHRDRPRQLQAHISHCGEAHRVTILCDTFSGHPKGYAHTEFATQSPAQAAVGLDSSISRGRVIKASVPQASPCTSGPWRVWDLFCAFKLKIPKGLGDTGVEGPGHFPKDTGDPA